MASMLLHFETDDYDTWKSMFDSDPAGRRRSATGHSISRSVDNPNSVFVRATFDSGDHIHLNDAGNQVMADAIGLTVFKK